MNNFRMWAYAMIATGLINWDYQRANHNVAIHSLAIVIPGALLLAITFSDRGRSALTKTNVQAAWFAIGIIALAYAFIN
jgi:sulfite exporter TauE/SafE